MPRKRKNGGTPIAAMSSKQIRRAKPINIDHLKTIEPLTDNQKKVFESYKSGKNLVLHGAAGTAVSYTHLTLPTKA